MPAGTSENDTATVDMQREDLREFQKYSVDGVELAGGLENNVERPEEAPGWEGLGTNRSIDVDRACFDSFKISAFGASSSGVFGSFQQPESVNASSHSNQEGAKASTSLKERKKITSIFGLPMISPFNYWGAFWFMVILMVDATYTSFFLPIRLAFLAGNTDSIADWALAIEIAAGVLFLIDIFVNFHVGFVVQYDYKKMVILNGKSVLWYYWHHGGLWIDVLAATPLFIELSVILAGGKSRLATVGAILRIFRIVRLMRWMKKLYYTVIVGNCKEDMFTRFLPVGVVYIGSVVYALAFMVNFLGCLLYLTARLEDDEFKGTWLENHSGNDAENYLTSIYWVVTTVTTVGYGDISPKTWIEQIIIMILMVTHIMLFGLLISSMSELMKSSNASARNMEQYKSRIADLGDWINSRKISSKLAKRIHAYYSELAHQSGTFDEAAIFQELPMNLRKEVAFTITKDFLRELRIFEEVEDNVLIQIAGRLTPIDIPPDQEYIREGDPVDAILILEEGVLSVQREALQIELIYGPNTCLESTILADEIPELGACPVTLLSRTSCHMWELKVKDIKPLFTAYPSLQESLQEGYRSHLLRHLGQFSSTSAELPQLEGMVEAQLGIDLTSSDAKAFKDKLGQTSTTQDLSKLMKDALRKSQLRQSTMRRDRRLEEIPESHLELSHHWNLESVLKHIRREIQMQGVNGMVDFVHKTKQLEKNSEGLSFEGFRACVLDLSLSDSDQRGLFSHLKKNGVSESIHASALIQLVRGSQAATSKAFLERVFNFLDKEQNGAVDITKVMKSFHAEHHGDVVSGKRSTTEVLIAALQALGNDGLVRLEDFINFNLDMGICICDELKFEQMTIELWGAPQQSGVLFNIVNKR